MRTNQTTLARTAMFSVRCWMLNVAVFATAANALAEVHYVDVNSTNATPPYTNWTTAATNIQDAVDAAVAGDEVVVTNGTYATGGRLDGSDDPNRVMVDKPLTVRSVNGPQLTTIDGGGSERCAYLTNGASLSGFTLTNGSDSGNDFGGGVAGSSTGAVVSNCVITRNQIVDNSYNTFEVAGGGAYSVTLNNCTLTSNSVSGILLYSSGDGFDYITADGGGAAYCTLNNCTLIGNSANAANDSYQGHSARAWGGAVYGCTLNNCVLNGNSVFANSDELLESSGAGGGAAICTLNNCTVSANSVAGRGFIIGGGAYGCTLNNCINFGDYAHGCEDCDSPGRLFGDNWFGDPHFVDTNGWANLRLRPNSPCINAGDNSYATSATDLDGNPRISGGTVDIGAYEYQCPQLTLIPYGANVLLLWPTNNAGYDYTGFTVQSTTNLGSPVWTTNSPAPVVIGGQNTVTNPITGPQQFYRLIQ